MSHTHDPVPRNNEILNIKYYWSHILFMEVHFIKKCNLIINHVLKAYINQSFIAHGSWSKRALLFN